MSASSSQSAGGYGSGDVRPAKTGSTDRSSGSTGSDPSAPQIPRIIWMLWFQGWDRAPYVCRNCKKSFELWNPGWEVRALDEKILPDVLGDYCKQFTAVCKANNPLAPLGMSWIPPASAADVLRLFLLQRYGGVWADATILCRKPLDETYSEIPIMSSFLASKPHHPLVEAWQERVHLHWQHQQRPDLEYFWLHLLFGQLVQDNHVIKDVWQRAKKPTAEYGLPGPHLHMPYEKVLARPPTEAFKELLAKKAEPIYKLTIHDVKFDKKRDALLQRDNSEFPGLRASSSGFQYLMKETLEEAESHFESCKGGAYPAWQPEPSSFRPHYGLSIANQPMMPGG
eukprot:s3254_g14.t1